MKPGRPFTALVVMTMLTGCASGPAFVPPTAPTGSAYSAIPLSARTDSALGALGGSQRFVEGVNADAAWWRELRSPKLDTLIAQALIASPSLDAAEATLRQAQERYAAQSGNSHYPQVDAGFGAQRQRFNPSALGQDAEPREFSLFSATVGVRYRLDLAGGNRRALEALAARADYQQFQVEGARLTLSASIAGTAVRQAQLSALVDAMEAMLRIEDDQLAITRERLRLGAASDDEVLALQLQREQSRAAIPQQRTLQQQSRHLLATLVGRAPSDGSVPRFEMAEFTLPVTVPVTVPSELVRRRPDIRAAEALMRAANAEYGSAVAKSYPQFNLSGTLGSQALTAGALFGSGSALWSLVAQLTQPLFNPGLSADKRGALAAFDAAAANYQNVVLGALRNVADQLRALDSDAQALSAWASADAAARAALESVQRQYSLGSASYLQVLTMQHQAQQTQAPLIAARAQRLVDTIALYQALGGDETPLTFGSITRRMK
ncbi:MAG: efflux transporter outer membrane subunit [Gemmatimonadaceae bacterium]|nr:efflux transporter outer membrane subunit [Gemmatimonadaceae bacterium]